MRFRFLAVCLASSVCATAVAEAATLEAAYTFNNTLNAQEGGVPALTATNPLGTNSYSTATLYGASRSLYVFNSSSGNNAGLTFDDGSSLIAPSSYSIEMVFSLNSTTNVGSGTGWLRLVDSQNRQSDDGFYVNPSQNFDIYPDGNGTALFSANTFYDVVLTDDGTTASVYVNGVFDFSVDNQGAGLNQMNLDNANNPGQLLNLFLDNTSAGGQGEYVGGKIALFEAFTGVLSAGDVASLAANPYANVPASGTSTPEPSTWMLLPPGALLLILKRRCA